MLSLRVSDSVSFRKFPELELSVTISIIMRFSFNFCIFSGLGTKVVVTLSFSESDSDNDIFLILSSHGPIVSPCDRCAGSALNEILIV